MHLPARHGRPALHARCLRWAAILLACLLTPAASAAAQAGSDISRIDIVGVDASSFPEVTVQARLLDENGQPAREVRPEDLILTEDTTEYSFSQRAVEAGVQAVLVADLGAGSGAPGATGQPRLEEIRTAITQYLEAMNPGDEAAIIQLNEEGTLLVQAMTPHQPTLLEAAASLTASSTANRLTNGYAGLAEALTVLEGEGNPGKAQAIVLLTGGIQTSGPVTYEEVVARAVELEIPVHTVLTNATQFPLSYNLERLAADTGGQSAYYAPDSDLTPIIGVLQAQGLQYELTYQSSLGTSGERTITLETRGGGPDAPRDFQAYSVELAAPRVVVDRPENGAAYVREAGQIGVPLDEVEPTEINVRAHVEWPDDHPRELVSAQLLVDEVAYGDALTDPGTVLDFTWDIRALRDEGRTTAQLQVVVADELGYTATSEPVAVSIEVRLPAEEGLVEEAADACAPGAALSIGQRVECFVSERGLPTPWLLALPVVLAGLLIWRGRALVTGAATFLDHAVVGLVRRVTVPVEPLTAAAEEPVEPAAHVIVVRGCPGLDGARFPLYPGRITPIGRDAEQSDIVLNGSAAMAALVGRKHCEIRHEDGLFKLRDFASVSGTYLNGARLPELGLEPLEDGDEILLGPEAEGGVVLRFEAIRPRRRANQRR